MGFLGNHIIDLYSIIGWLTGQLYLALMKNEVEPMFTQEKLKFIMYLQQDGTPSDYDMRFREYFNMFRTDR